MSAEETGATASASNPTPVDLGPNGPGSLGRLIPWPDDETYPNIPAEDALELFLGWVESRGMQLWDHQEEALHSQLHQPPRLLHGAHKGTGQREVLQPG